MALRHVAALALALGVLTADAAAQDRWTYACSDGVEAGRGVYYTLASDAPGDGCLWTRTDGTVEQALPDEIGLFLDELEGITDWFRDSGFREPRLATSDGQWVAVIYPREGPACFEGSCTEMQGRPGMLQGGDDGSVLIMSSDALLASARPTLIALMMAVQDAYPTAFPRLGSCEPACWIRYGIPYGFARWWLWQTLRDRLDVHARFGRPLPTGAAASEMAEGAYTAEFWEGIARYITDHHESPWEPMEGFAYTAELFEALDRGEEPMAALERVLGQDKYEIGTFKYGAEKVPSAVSMAYATFIAGQARRRQLAAPEPPLAVAVGEAERRRVPAHPPLAVVRIPVTVTGLDEPAALSVRVEDATPSISYNVVSERNIGLYDQRIDPAEGRFDYGTSTETLCPDAVGDCTFDVVVVNSHPEAASRSVPQSYTVVVEAHEVCRLGDGVRGVTYAVEGPTPQTGARGTTARIALDVPASIRDRGVNPIDGRVAILAGPRPIKTRFRARLACDSGGIRLTDVRFSNPALDAVAGPMAASVRGPNLAFSPTLEVGDALPDVVSRSSLSSDGEAALTAASRLYGLRVTDQTERDVKGLGPIDVWRIEGRVRSEMQTEDGTVAMLERGGADFEGDLDRPVQDAMRDAGFGAISQRRVAAEQLVDELAGADDQPVVIYYSPMIGSVETTTGSGREAATSRLVEVRLDPEID